MWNNLFWLKEKSTSKIVWVQTPFHSPVCLPHTLHFYKHFLLVIHLCSFNRLSIRRQTRNRLGVPGIAPRVEKANTMHRILLHKVSFFPIWVLTFVLGKEGRGWPRSWGSGECVRVKSGQWGHRNRVVWGRRWGGGVLLWTRWRNGARTGSQRERGRLQSPHGFFISPAAHHCRLHPQQPRLITVVSGTDSESIISVWCWRHVPPRWCCSFHLLLTFGSFPSFLPELSSSVCSEDLEALQAHKIWKKAIMLVWRAAANHRSVCRNYTTLHDYSHSCKPFEIS